MSATQTPVLGPGSVRCQGAILRDGRILLIQQRHFEDGRTYWLLPGGGMEPGETEEECVRREMREETCLEVSVVRLLTVDPDPIGYYETLNTYLCSVTGGDETPGYEPEPEAAAKYCISEVGWFDLADISGWDPLILCDAITYPLLLQIRTALGVG